MSSEKKNRTISCSDEEWEQIKSLAEEARVSVSRYIVLKICSEQNSTQFSADVSDQIRRILNGVRLLAFDRMDELYENLGEEKADAYLIRAKGNYRGME